MAKRKTRRSSSRSSSRSTTTRRRTKAKGEISDETRKGLFVIILFALGILLTLSYFGVAGTLGDAIDMGSKVVLGFGRWVLPIMAFAWGYKLLNPQALEVRFVHLLGAFFVFSSILAFIAIVTTGDFDRGGLLTPGTGEAAAAGWAGIALAYPVVALTGKFAGGSLMVLLLLAGFMLMFNVSIITLWEKLKMSWSFSARMGEKVQAKVTTRRERKELEAEVEAAQPAFKVKEVSNGDEMVTGEMGDADAEEHAEAMSVSAAPKRRRPKIDIPLNLLTSHKGKPTSGDIHTQKEYIRKALENFGIDVEMGAVAVGPTVTQFSLKPADGIKLSRITALHNDLSLALAAHPLRIEAPIPGKSLVGIEVPNKSAATVGLREILASKELTKIKEPLGMGLARDVAGEVFAADLAGMPHLLVAGSTGSGKSVCVNVMILNLLFRNSPDDLKFIMVDPKRVELTMYNGIPHLLTPVITEVDKTVNALKWSVAEMDRRYQLLSEAGKKSIATYNASAATPLPNIVLIIDELADLMAVAAKEVEAAIIRLAQMARAVGIHLVLATQRPSVNVITGLIKANITTRIAFNVASSIDSRTILDHAGAEKLLGKGDMLFISAAMSKPKRAQGAFVSEKEIAKVVKFLKSNSEKPEYDESVVEKRKGKGSIPGSSGGGGGDDEDDMLSEAKQVIFRAGKASASLLQRRLRIGYARAARILDILEEEGFIGPADGARPREVLIQDMEQFGASGVPDGIPNPNPPTENNDSSEA